MLGSGMKQSLVILAVTVLFAGSPTSADNTAAGPPEARQVLFRTDSAVIDSPFVERLERHGKFLASHPEARIRLEEHTDRRGSREYNLALGERRVQAILLRLIAQGASVEQLESVSFGEEVRIARDGDANAMSQNRRMDIVYFH